MYTTNDINSMEIGELEKVLHYANTVAYPNGDENYLTDADFTRGLDRLEKEKPSSYVLTEINGVDTEKGLLSQDIRGKKGLLLQQCPMRSIIAVSREDDLSALGAYVNRIPKDCVQMISLKGDGHAFSAEYKNGIFDNGFTRGRNSLEGNDITRHLSILLPRELKGLLDFTHAQLRGEIVLPFENFKVLRERHKDEVAKGNLKNIRNSVSSLLKEGASEEDIKLLKLAVYNIVVPNDEKDKAEWTKSRTSKFEVAREWGLLTPDFMRFNPIKGYNKGMNYQDFYVGLVDYFGKQYKDNCEYRTDGIVIVVDDEEQFEGLGHTPKYNNGALAMKIGKWEANAYTAKIKRIYLTGGAKNKSIMAEIEPVETSIGSTITSLELKSIPIMESVNAYVGNTVQFQYSSDMIPDLLYPGHGM